VRVRPSAPESAVSEGARRRATRGHYDRYPFGFDDSEILAEKLDHRLMGEAIRELAKNGTLVLDVGCGACRVARLVRWVSEARTLGIDISRESIRAAARADVGPLVQGDNLRLPLRTGCADLVISNGVIHHTPDAKTSFRELVRVIRPGGTLVVSVYDRHGWYYYAYTYLGACIRGLRRLIGDRGLRVILLPPFHLALWILLPLATRRRLFVSRETAWNLFHDQFTTPQCTFHSMEEMAGWAEEMGLVTEAKRREAARQLVSLRLRKPVAA